MAPQRGFADDRGRIVPLFDAERMRGAPALGHPDVAFAFRRAGAEFAGGGGYLVLVDGVVGAGLFVIVAMLGLPSGLMWLLVIGGFVVLRPRCRSLVRAIGDRTRSGRAAAQMVRAGLCPSCAYDLVGLAVEADGCVVCAECGGAWRAERVARAEPLGPAPETGWLTPSAAGYTEAADQGVRDCRGRRTPLLYTKPRQILEWEWTDEARGRVVRGIGAAMRATRPERWAVAALLLALSAGLVGLVVFIMLRIARDPGATGWRDFGMASAILVLPAALVMAAVWTVRGRSLLQLGAGARAFAGCGICPSCYSALPEGAVEADGCTTCPGCGAAWRLGGRGARAGG